MLKGETRFGGAPAPEPCENCGGTEFPLQVCFSGGGYYVGTLCGGCGAPESRETGYFRRRADAEKTLQSLRQGDLTETRAAQAGMTPAGMTPIAVAFDE